MKKKIIEWKLIVCSKLYILNLIGGFLFCLFSFYLSNCFSEYADSVSGPPLKDFILDKLPILDVNILFFLISLLGWSLLLIYHIVKPNKLPYLLWCFGAFFLVRAFFIVLTHIGPPVNMLNYQNIFSFNVYKADLFFSGHTGAPFFLALLTSNSRLRILCVIFSILMGATVLLGHIHYSIDVFASFFITHSLVVIIKKIKKYFMKIK